jgi:VCBS repeat-containing protein
MNSYSEKFLLFLFITLLNNISHAATYTFTNAGATGENGPNQNQINSEYAGTNLANSVTINSPGVQEWVVPVTATYEIEVWGAQGGSGGWYSIQNYSSTGGLGGYAKGSITLSAGTRIYLHVGQQGEGYPTSSTKMENLTARKGGWNGGGNNSISNYPGTGGGGASDVRIGGISLTDRVIVGGGGGGGGNSGSSTQLSNGGAGGGLTAVTLANSTQFSNRTPGSGATQNSGNALGVGATANQNLSGGGGGGYYGGGAGANSTGGGGGSSYIGGVSNGSTQSGIRSGHGKIVITSPQSITAAPVISQGAGPLVKSTNEDSTANWSSSELNATDSDTNSSFLAWSIISHPNNGSVTIDGNGSYPSTFSYQPNTNYFGSDSFSIQVSDGENNDSVTINLTISPVNDPTTLSGDLNSSLPEDGSITGDINASDSDGLTDGTYFSLSTNPSNGTASIDQQTGQWTYSPNANFHGIDSFSVSITDDQNYSSNHSISLTVTSVNDPTTLSGDLNSSLPEDGNMTGDINASDSDGLTDGTYFSLFTNPSNGTASIDQQTGQWTYSPNANFHGMDSFSVSITDDQNNSSTHSISISVTSVNDLPFDLNLSNNQIFENLPVGSTLGIITASDTDQNESINFSFTDGNGSNHNHLFLVDTNGSIKTSSILDYENSNELFIRVQATDSHGGSTKQNFSIQLQNIVEDFDSDGIEDHFDPDDDNDSFTDIEEIAYGSDPMNASSVANKSPNGIFLTVYSFVESKPKGSVIGILTASDPDTNATHSFSLQNGSETSNNNLFKIDQNHTLCTNSLFRYSEEQNQYIIRVLAIDEHNASFAQSIILKLHEDSEQILRLGSTNSTLDVNRRVSFNTLLSYDRNISLPSFNYVLSSSEDFSNIIATTKATLNKDTLIGSIFNLDQNTTYYARVEGTIDGKLIISKANEFSTHTSMVSYWWMQLEESHHGWRQSEWLGNFLPHKSGWIYHQSIGWLYSHPGVNNDFWFWSQEYNWIWTKEGIYPFLYRNNSSNWLYLLGVKDGKAIFHDYSIELGI